MGSWWTSVAVGVLIALVVFGLLLFLAVPHMCPSERSARVKSAHNVRTMITMAISRSHGPVGRGRNWILSLVSQGALDARNRQNLEVLWPPNLEERCREIDWSAYKAITPEVLKTKRFPHLTGYAGPGEDEPDWKGARPLIGDLTFDDGAIIGFTSGSARWLDREELGLGEDDPIVAGPTSKSPLLRMLSDE